MKKLIAGNWKMNCLRDEARALLGDIIETLADQPPWLKNCDILVCPPFTSLGLAGKLLYETDIHLGAQDCHAADKGAHTGDISASMLADIGCDYVIVGHSERRQNHNETDELVRQKATAILAQSMKPIICVGETLEQRQAGQHIETVLQQLVKSIPDNAGEQMVIAYEPVWAIGTGQVASLDNVAEMHGAIYKWLDQNNKPKNQIRLLYGGSVKPDNAGEILSLPHVNGALIGGASLKAEDFLNIAAATLRRKG